MATVRYKIPAFAQAVNIPGYGRIDVDGGGWVTTSDAALQAKLIAAGAISEAEIGADNTGGNATAGQTTLVLAAADTALTPDHVGKQVYNNSATNVTYTIKKTSNLVGQAWTPGNVIAVARTGTGTVTLAIDAGGTLNNVGTKTVAQNDTPLVLQMTDTLDVWNVL